LRRWAAFAIELAKLPKRRLKFPQAVFGSVEGQALVSWVKKTDREEGMR
jgi:hypothetical protein